MLELSIRDHRNYIALVRLYKNKVPSNKRTRGSAERFTKAKKEEILLKQGGKCPSCGVRYSKLDKGSKSNVDRYPTTDHIIPWQYGGLRTIYNSTIICHKCNQHRAKMRKLALLRDIESHYGTIDRSLIEDFDLDFIEEWWLT